ncbi:MAG TPA: hypothetical protein ENN80_02300 [Candidatus Hydrogenedentes bacterium]|nr:hypothetical protein [Candidatus Hydrogenedentota bacterium]
MRPRRLIAVLLVFTLAGTVLLTAQRRLDGLRGARGDENELLYLPNQRLLNHFTAGLSNVIADLLWLQCVQYIAREFKTEQTYTWLNHMCETITRLDPYFVAAYRYGGIFLAALKADDAASIKLLHDGIVHNPDTWQLPYEMACVYLVNRRDDPDSKRLAAQYLAIAAATGEAPAFVTETAQALMQEEDLLDIERGMWEHMRASDDQLMRDVARRKLEELKLRMNCRGLNQAVSVFEETQGRPPKDLSELTSSGFLSALPSDPMGGRYFIDADGKVKNTTVLDAQVQKRLRMLQGAVDRFEKNHGRYPRSLDELVSTRVFSNLPPHPYAGRTWGYDADSGKVQGG